MNKYLKLAHKLTKKSNAIHRTHLKMNRYLKLAHKLSLQSTAKTHGMAAVVVRGGALLSVGINLGFRHAETRSLRPHVNYAGADIYIMRRNKGTSKPCPACQRKIAAAGIRRAIYISVDGIETTETYKNAEAG
jgi:deoxycytidylate deaminase